MALYVQTNTSSINSQRMLARSTRQLDTSYERLSSGLRINSAKDDAAGLQISNRMASQINGLTQGNRNANDGISMCQVTEGALDEVTSMLQRIRTLAIQSANGTNSSAERIAINEEVQQLIKEVRRVGTDTSYGGNLKILGPDVSDTVFQVGSNAYQTISLTMKSLSKLVTVTALVNIPN
ncbi:MAG: flagellin, partial [Succinivibrionaceae bacterium]|nr:flagellin [Succinivibrionaceae bacterium]